MSASKHSGALQRAVEAAGEAWASDWANALRFEGRAVAGGWPGTIREARQRVVACAIERLGPRSTISPAELEALTRRAYDVAKKAWLARTEADDSEP